MTISNDSRYVDAAYEFADTHTYGTLGTTEVNENGNLNINTRETSYLLTTRYSSPPPRRYMVKDTDNIQYLAYKTLQDPTRWWIIANANPQIRNPFDLTMGDLIYIPE
jgi:hypothetical protein